MSPVPNSPISKHMISSDVPKFVRFLLLERPVFCGGSFPHNINGSTLLDSFVGALETAKDPSGGIAAPLYAAMFIVFCWLLSTQGHRKNAHVCTSLGCCIPKKCIFIHYWSHPWHLWKRCCILGKHTIPASWPGVHCTRKIRCSTKWRHKLWCSLPNQTIRWNYTCQWCARQRGRWHVFSFRPFSTLSKLQNSKKKGSEKMILYFHHLSSTGVLSSEMEKKTCHQQFRQMHGGVH